ncbi:putative oxygenase MesX [Asaia prunellae]|uniref:putative oxygenase MesX n=1 Tax=Asaia prunellae TaxID=610245 RepID=UPI0004705029|nr:putative oxygenase MesX [Asaia prunellae]
MTNDFAFTIKQLRFDEHYAPAPGTRLTTNFANLARGESRQDNLRAALQMIDQRFNDLAEWDNPDGTRYTLSLDIVSIEMTVAGSRESFPAIELLQTTIFDRTTGKHLDGIMGNNFSSYVRDYDFSVVLPEHNRGRDGFSVPEDFGVLHGSLFQTFIASKSYQDHFRKPPVICLSVSENRIYTRTTNRHPVLGVEYTPDQASLTERYFGRMGMQVRYFMPPGAKAPLAFYFFGDLLNDYTPLELISTISTMETFQRIYRPEIYNANSAAAAQYRPSLKQSDYSNTRIIYDREERTRLAIEQGQFAGEHFIAPHRAFLEQWVTRRAA